MAALILHLQDWMAASIFVFNLQKSPFDSTKNARLGRILCWHTHYISNISMKYWTSRTGSKHLQQWMWTRLQLQHPSDIDNVMCTAPCRRVRAIAWVAFVAHPPTPQLQKPPVVGNATSRPVTRTRLTFPFVLMHIWEDRRGLGLGVGGGRRCWIQMFSLRFCGFLSVLLLRDWLYRGFNKNTTARGRVTGDKWSNCAFVCVETPILLLFRKTTEQVNGCPAPQRLPPQEAYLLRFWNKFSLLVIFCLEM